MTTTLLYDGSFNGLMTAVFTIYHHKIKSPIIARASREQKDLFGTTVEVITENDKAERVWKKFLKICDKKGAQDVYKAFLSEIIGIENTIYEYLKMTFAKQQNISNDYGNSVILKVTQAAKMVEREKHRMEAFVRFHLIEVDIYYANIEPDFNVLPLISTHFKNRYADQKWIIYDLNRDYGISYDLQSVQEVKISFDMPRQHRGIMNSSDSEEVGVAVVNRFRESENNYRNLWNQYFKSTNITSRKNMKLHIQHVPKRYWKYLSEKQ